MNIGPSTWIVYLIGALVCGYFSAEIADRKGNSRGLFFTLGFLLGCLGLLLAAVMPSSGGLTITTGSLVRFVKNYPLEGGGSCAKGYASKVHDVAVKFGAPAALIDGPDGSRYWVPMSVLRQV
ncbi:MAG: hypothetical protein WCG62_05020 [Actinomycetes bacterium]